METLTPNKIYCMDCIEGLKRIEDKSVDIVVTSPPYNIGVKYNSYSDNLDIEHYLEWIERIVIEVKRVLKDNGSFFVNLGYTCKNPWIAFDVANVIRKHFVLQNTIHWVKSIAIQKQDVGNYPNIVDDIAVGNFKPINSGRYLSIMHEYIFHFTKSGNVRIDKLAVGVPYQDKRNIDRFNREADLRDRGNVWFIPYKPIRSREKDRPHPATFPSKLPEMCIKLHGVKPNTLVLDPFMGIGNTAIACVKLGVNYIGFEIDKHYREIAEQRLRDLPKP